MQIKKLSFLLFLIMLIPTSLYSQSNDGWELLGKVNGVYKIESAGYSGGEESIHRESEILFIYTKYDGEKMIYRAFDPSSNKSYNVIKSSNYTGADVKYNHSGRRITSIPPLCDMFTHFAGPYHFNISNVRK